MWRGIICLFFVGSAIAQPPLIDNRKVLNAARYVPPNLPAGAIERGATFPIFGTRLGPTQPVQASQFPLGSTLGNVSITITQGTTVVNAIPTFVINSQINAIMPSNAPLGAVPARVSYNNFRSNPMTAIVAANSVGIFSARGTGFGPGILQNFVSQSVQPINSPTISAKPGQAITLGGTGLGTVASDVVSPPVGLPTTRVEVFVGGIAAPILYSGRTPCCAGIDQIVFTIPQNAPQGCWVKVAVRTAGATVSNMVTMAITADGASCFDSFTPPPFVRAGTYGAFNAVRATTRQDTGTKIPIEVAGDFRASSGTVRRSRQQWIERTRRIRNLDDRARKVGPLGRPGESGLISQPRRSTKWVATGDWRSNPSRSLVPQSISERIASRMPQR